MDSLQREELHALLSLYPDLTQDGVDLAYGGTARRVMRDAVAPDAAACAGDARRLIGAGGRWPGAARSLVSGHLQIAAAAM